MECVWGNHACLHTLLYYCGFLLMLRNVTQPQLLCCCIVTMIRRIVLAFTMHSVWGHKTIWISCWIFFFKGMPGYYDTGGQEGCQTVKNGVQSIQKLSPGAYILHFILSHLSCSLYQGCKANTACHAVSAHLQTNSHLFWIKASVITEYLLEFLKHKEKQTVVCNSHNYLLHWRVIMCRILMI